MLTLLVDGDINIYKACAAVEKAWCVESEYYSEGLWMWYVHPPDAINHLERQIDLLQRTLNPDKMIFALSDKANFRMDVLPTYKSNRKATKKPLLLPVIREYLIEHYDTFQRPKLEGDDVLGILATSKRIIQGDKIIVSIDKDMKTIPSKFIHRPEDGILDITVEEADRYHMYQTLIGDTTDGYKGCPSVGPVKADKILDQAEADGVPLWDAVCATYEKAGLDVDDALQQARVARILRVSDYDFKNKEVILWTP